MTKFRKYKIAIAVSATLVISEEAIAEAIVVFNDPEQLTDEGRAILKNLGITKVTAANVDKVIAVSAGKGFREAIKKEITQGDDHFRIDRVQVSGGLTPAGSKMSEGGPKDE